MAKHLTQTQRCTIKACLSSGMSQALVAAEVGVNQSTISRELRRNGEPNGTHFAGKAQKRHKERKRNAGASRPSKLTAAHWDHINDGLLRGHCIDAIAHARHRPELHLSTSWLYALLDRAIKAGNDADLAAFFKRKHRKRRGPPRRRRGAGVHLIPNRVDIDQRPAEVEDRAAIGHWEADLVLGAKREGVFVTLIERRARFARCAVVGSKRKDEVSDAIIQLLRPHAAAVRSITFDNGGEFAAQERVASALACRTYFAKAYRSWQRGSNERCNGQLRWHCPKGEPLDEAPHEELAEVVEHINDMPRRILAFHSPREMFDAEAPPTAPS